MIKLKVEPYCENCECFEPTSINNIISSKSVDTVVVCKNSLPCAIAVDWVRRHDKEQQISID